MLRKLSPRARTWLAVAVIAVATVLMAFYAPAQSPAPIMGPEPAVTVVATNPRSTAEINHEFDFKGVHLTIKTVELADKFSDDKNRKGKYTLRVLVDAINNGKDVIGLTYVDDVFLMLPDGEKVRVKRVSVKPAALPGELQSGFIDYPLETAVDITKLKLSFSDGTVVSFKQA
jgi:hypothetical protein